MNDVSSGRFPSHLLISHAVACTVERCVDGCPVRLMDAQSGNCKSGGGIRHTKGKHFDFLEVHRDNARNNTYTRVASEGGASRYFQTFRPADDSSKHAALMQYLLRLITPPNGTVLDLTNNNTTRQACTSKGFHAISISSSTNDQ